MLVTHPGELKSRFGKTLNKGRKPKDYRIRLDNDGNCIVSEVVWKRLQEAGASFIVLNEVPDPPNQSLSMQEGTYHEPAVYKEIAKAVHEVAPPGVKTFKLGVVKRNG
jgi:hypothetical protein